MPSTSSVPRQRKPTQDRQLEIADAALRLIASRGIASFTMEELAREVGVTAGSLFRHFRSREEILAAAVKRAEGLLVASFPAPGLPPLERLQRFVTARIRLVGNRTGIAQLIFSEQFMKALDPVARRRLLRVVALSQRFLRDAIAEAQLVGAVRTDIPAADLVVLTMGAVMASTLAPRTDPESVVRTLLGVLAPPGKRPFRGA